MKVQPQTGSVITMNITSYDDDGCSAEADPDDFVISNISSRSWE